MPVTDNRTSNRNLKEPAATNTIADDVLRLIDQVRAIDVDLANVLSAIATKIDATALVPYQVLSGRNAANGYAGLNALGQVETSALPSSIAGGLNYKGTWNAALNSPAIPAASTANKGWFYKVAVDGATLISGISDWKVQDWIVSNGTSWDKIDNTELPNDVDGIIDASADAKALLLAANYAAMKTLLGIALASTTDVLTGTDAAKYLTSDALAALWESNTTDITSGATIPIGEGHYFNLTTSTAAITAFAITTDRAGREFWVKFNTARVLTHNATNLEIVEGAKSILTAAGDYALIQSKGSGNVRVLKYVRASGAAVVDTGPTLATEIATTSGTSHDFTGIPAGTKRITVMFDKVSTTGGTSAMIVQVGDSGGIENTGYESGALQVAVLFTASTSGFIVTSAMSDAFFYSGSVVLTLQDASNTWTQAGNILQNGNNMHLSAGVKALSATLDRLRITTASGADTFDAGSVNISYE